MSPVKYATGDVIPFQLTPAIVVASFFVSLIGAITTVELLQRRTRARGWVTWFELGSCAVSFGLVAIWCMHYVGNRAIVLADGEAEMQLTYNPGYTALSSFIPIIAVFLAFVIADRRHAGDKDKFVIFSLVASGIVAGLAIVGMHYIGSLGVPNYQIIFDPSYIGGAILIACIACVTALTLIFVLQDRWISILPYRLMTAVLLAGAVSGMHYEATMGTAYVLKYRNEVNGDERNTNVIIATVISLCTIPICLGIAISTTRRQKQLADRAQQVILACARFDPDGKLMVTHEGLLPSQKISVHANERSFEDQFNVTHPAFQWIFRVSHNWPSIIRWIPSMRRHLQAVNFVEDPRRKRSHTNSTDSSVSWEVTPESEDYSVIFRQSFCVAASDLAAEFNEPLAEIGSLYDGVMMTGTLAAGGSHRKGLGWSKFPPSALVRDLEASIGVDVIGKGQLLFLVQECDKRETARLTVDGYCFVSVDKIEGHLAKSMQVPSPYLSQHLKDLRNYARAERAVDTPQGTLLGCFVLRAGISKRNWEVLVRKDKQYRLPCVQLTPLQLDPLMSRLLTSLDGLSVTNCLTRLSQRIEAEDEPHREFWMHFKKKLGMLAESVNEPFFRQAIFSSKLIRIPTLNPSKGRLSYCSLVAFHIIPDVHAASLKGSPGLAYTPLSFFRCRQEVLEGVQHRAFFDRKIHQEFAALFATKEGALQRPPAIRKGSLLDRASRKMSSLTTKSSMSESTKSLHPTIFPRGFLRPDSVISEYETGVHMSQSPMPFGGIMVSSDVTVEMSTAEPGEVATSSKSYAGMANAEVSTYVDELYSIAVARWQRM